MGDFACPECGSVVRVSARVPGRQSQCPSCGTLVEVPFLPRVAPRSRRPLALVPPVVWAVAGVLVALSVGVMVVKGAWRAQTRSAQRQEVAALEARIAQAAQADNTDETIGALEAALARADLPWSDDQKQAMRKRREELAVRRAETELDRLGKLPPHLALRDGMAFLEKIAGDPALESHLAGGRRLVAQAASRRFDDLLEQGDSALARGEAAEALTQCERLMDEVRGLPEWAAGPYPDKGRALGRRIAERHGAHLAPVAGTFWLGSVEQYEKALRSTLLAVLRERGYAPEPSDSSLRAIWTEVAPFRLTLTVVEKAAGPYLQSANQVAHLDGQMVLKRPGLADWKQSAQGQTEVPLPNLRAYQASRIAVGSTPSADFQGKLYENAFHSLVQKLDRLARTMPPRPAPPG